MDITSQITVSMKPEPSKSLWSANAIKAGSILKLKILELRGDRALIDFGDFRATADIKIPVTLGEELRVRVLESGNQLKMSVINPESKNPPATEIPPDRSQAPTADRLQKVQADLRQILNRVLGSQTGTLRPQSILNILNSLNSYFEPIDLTEVITKLIPRLKAYLENPGVFFEKYLEDSILKAHGSSEFGTAVQPADLPDVKHILERDLKANLLAMKFLMEDKETLQSFLASRAMTIMNHSINSLLSDIIQQQGRAVGQLDSAEPFQVFTYVLPLKDGGQTARLKVYYQKKQKSGPQKGFRISVLLSMDRLGDLRTDFFLLNKELTITFFVKADSVKAKLQENFVELQNLLDGFFNQILLKVMVSEKKVMAFDHEDLQLSGDRRVDLRI